MCIEWCVLLASSMALSTTQVTAYLQSTFAFCLAFTLNTLAFELVGAPSAPAFLYTVRRCHQTSSPSAWLPSLPPLVQLRLRPPPLLLLLLSLPPGSIPPRLRITRLVLSRQPSPRRSAVSTSPVVLGLGTFIFHVYIVALADYLTVTSCSRLPPALTSTRSS
jgi:hypothetical protein